MRVTEILREGLRREYEFAYEESEIFEKVEGKLLEAQPGVNLRGFRTGRVPIQILRQRFGESVRLEVIQDTIKDALSQHLEETGNRPAMTPESKLLPDGEVPKSGLAFQISYECLPEIPAVELGELKIDRLVAKPNQGFIDKHLDSLAKSNPDYVDYESGRAAEKDDVVVVEYKLDKDVKGVPREGRDLTIEIGAGDFQDGKDIEFIGARVGDVVNVEGAFRLSGNESVISVGIDCTVTNIRRKSPAELGDALALKLGLENWDGLVASVTRRSEIEIGEISDFVFKRNLVDALLPKLMFEIPEKLRDQEISYIGKQVEREESEMSEEDLKRHADRRLRLGLFYSDLARKHEFGVTEAEIEQALKDRSSSQAEYETLVAYTRSNPVYGRQIVNGVLEEKAVGYISELATVEEKEVDCDELVRVFESERD
ncbi:MAG: trigger factor [Albidovulum sp.]|nr:trigger factor [Albidovulum sp.]